MENLTKTQREFKNVETGIVYSLYQHTNGNFHLILDKEQGETAPALYSEVNGFYICSHTSVDIKLNGEKLVKLDAGNFYNLKEGEQVTHKKYCGFKRFTKA